MLIQYSVQNYKSIKNEVIINFTKTSPNNQSKWTISNESPNYQVYKALALVGPNASGKSNILKSFLFALNFVKNTISRRDKAKINTVPFLLDKKASKENTSFEFIYIYNTMMWVSKVHFKNILVKMHNCI